MSPFFVYVCFAHDLTIWLSGLLLCLQIIIVTTVVALIVLFHFILRDCHQPLAKLNIQLKIPMERIIIIINTALVGINHGYRSSRLHSLVHETTLKRWRCFSWHGIMSRCKLRSTLKAHLICGIDICTSL